MLAYVSRILKKPKKHAEPFENKKEQIPNFWFQSGARENKLMGTEFKNNPRSMARTKKRLKIIIMGHRDSLSYLILSCQGATANFCYKVEGRRASNANSVIHFFLNLNPYWSFNLGPRPCHFVVAHWTGSGFVGLSRGTVYWMKFTQVLA